MQHPYSTIFLHFPAHCVNRQHSYYTLPPNGYHHILTKNGLTMILAFHDLYYAAKMCFMQYLWQSHSLSYRLKKSFSVSVLTEKIKLHMMHNFCIFQTHSVVYSYSYIKLGMYKLWRGWAILPKCQGCYIE